MMRLNDSGLICKSLVGVCSMIVIEALVDIYLLWFVLTVVGVCSAASSWSWLLSSVVCVLGLRLQIVFSLHHCR